jgi:hypothetical protein
LAQTVVQAHEPITPGVTLAPNESRRELEGVGGPERVPLREQCRERAYLIGGLDFVPIFGEKVERGASAELSQNLKDR